MTPRYHALRFDRGTLPSAYAPIQPQRAKQMPSNVEAPTIAIVRRFISGSPGNRNGAVRFGILATEVALRDAMNRKRPQSFRPTWCWQLS
jgi:hypothetical protein